MIFIKEDDSVNKHIRQNASLNFVIVYKEDAEAKDKEQINDFKKIKNQLLKQLKKNQIS